eukprot:TRINITY_DN29403_c0_g1_i1.p1 TRINITY_DN29403_c0_g1~~TRINITY_DN29403_c0_g1_i1.p1  ORF type:complete len:146 (-),score=23.21 TRINITY_DN29403_c0_g1_i1:146-583(-)
MCIRDRDSDSSGAIGRERCGGDVSNGSHKQTQELCGQQSASTGELTPRSELMWAYKRFHLCTHAEETVATRERVLAARMRLAASQAECDVTDPASAEQQQPPTRCESHVSTNTNGIDALTVPQPQPELEQQKDDKAKCGGCCSIL